MVFSVVVAGKGIDALSLFPLDRVLAKRVRAGRLAVIDPGGMRHDFGDPLADPDVVIRLHSPRVLWDLARHPSLQLGEAYVDGGLTIERGTLRDLLRIALVSQDQAIRESRFYGVLRKLGTLYHAKAATNLIGHAERNVRHHYDIGQAFYRLLLDRDMQYSCGYWRESTKSLDQAQTEKKRHIARKLLLKPGMEVLEIGSGWGGLALQLAREHDVNVTGLTLSRDQYETSVRRAEDAGLQDKVRFKLLDYRLVDGSYDRIVSVGMFEHVGRPSFGKFFGQVHRLLKDDGIALIHTIAKMWDPGPTNPWIRTYIFPGGHIPTLSELAPVVERSGLWLTDMENLRLHYAFTLNAWNERFQQHRAQVSRMFDERFCRMWEFYLQGCEAGFRYQELCVFQMQLAKTIAAVPITRDYLYTGSPAFVQNENSDNVLQLRSTDTRRRR